VVVPSVKTIVPLGTLGLVTVGATVTVKVTPVPTVDGFRELVSVATVGTPMTVWVPVAVVPVKFTLPGQAAEMG